MQVETLRDTHNFENTYNRDYDLYVNAMIERCAKDAHGSTPMGRLKVHHKYYCAEGKKPLKE